MPASLEALETRIAPAALVTASYDPATGVLTLDGSADANAHEVTIYATGPATFRVDGNSTDLGMTGTPFLDLKKLTKVTYIGGSAADTLHLWGLKTLTELNFTGTGGEDTIDAFDLTVSGAVHLNLGSAHTAADFYGKLMSIGGDLTVNYGGGGRVNFNATTNIFKSGIVLTGGAGDDEFSLGGSSASVAKGIAFASGAGTDRLTLSSGLGLTVNKAADGRAVAFSGTTGSKVFEGSGLGVMALKGTVEFTGGTGGNQVDFGVDSLQVDGDLKLTGGAGRDDFHLGDRSLRVGGNYQIDLGGGANTADLFTRSGTVGKALSIIGGSAADEIDFSGGSLTVSGAVTVAAGDGANTIDLHPMTLIVRGALAVSGGANNDEIRLDSRTLMVAGATSLTGGDGSNEVALTPDFGSFSKGVVYTGGTADDRFEFGNTSATVTTAFTVSLGGGANAAYFNATTLTISGDLTITDAVTVAGGTASNHVEFNADTMKVGGATTLRFGNGTNDLQAYLPMATFAKTFSYFGGAGADEIHLGGVKLTAAGLAISLGDGENTLELNPGTLAVTDALTVLGGTGGDVVDLNQHVLTVSKLAQFSLGDGANDFHAFAHVATLSNQLQVTGGAGVDLLTLDVNVANITGLLSIDGGAGADNLGVYGNTVALKGGLTINGGDGADQVVVYADGTVTGDLKIDLGAAADDVREQTATIASYSGLATILKVSGMVKVDSSAVDGASHFHDKVVLAELAVTKDVVINTGAAASDVNIDSITVGSNFSLNTGEGNDSVGLDHGRTYGAMTIAKITSILLGGGNDEIVIGGPNVAGTNSLVKFYGAVTVDGGSGANTSNDFAGPNMNFFGPAVVVTKLGFP